MTRSRSGEVLITLTWRREALISSVDPTGRWNTRISRPRAKYLSLVDAISRKRSHRRATWLKCENLITFSELELFTHYWSSAILDVSWSSAILGVSRSSAILDVWLSPWSSSPLGHPPSLVILTHPRPLVLLRPWSSFLPVMVTTVKY